jgi:hypothetical protein
MKSLFHIGLALGFLTPLFSSCSGELPGDTETKDPVRLREILVTESNGLKIRTLQAENNPDIQIQEVTSSKPKHAVLSATGCETWAFAQFGINWVNRYGIHNQTGNAEACAAFPFACSSFAYADVILGICNNSSTDSVPANLVLHGVTYSGGTISPNVWTAWHAANNPHGKYAIQGAPNGAPANYDLLTGTSQN